MNWWFALPSILSLVFAFLFGLGAGSFVNVLVARLPYEKSVLWPASHCFSCLKAIRWIHNVPLLGYLILRGKCKHCGATFSSRYFWVELTTGVAFAAIYCVDVLSHAEGGPGFIKPWHNMPGLKHPFLFVNDWTPLLMGWAVWISHTFLFTLLLAASLIDADHRIIPTTLTYPGTVIGLVISTLMPWPWPSSPDAIPVFPGNPAWIMPQFQGVIPDGVQLWPFAGPPPAWAPAGSWKLGFLNGLLGAAAGMFAGRGLKFVYESTRGKEALGLGDADLLMLVGSFLGWQVAVISLPFGALMTLLFIVPRFLYQLVNRKPIDPVLPFGPGLAAGAFTLWLLWPWLNEPMRMLFDPVVTAFAIGVPAIGIAACGLILRARK